MGYDRLTPGIIIYTISSHLSLTEPMKTLARTLTLAACLAAPTYGFADTLAEIFDLALNNDPQLRAANAAYLANRETANITRAGLLPRVAATAEYGESDADDDSSSFVSFLGDTSSTVGTTDSDQTLFTLSITQPLFDLPAWYDHKQGRTVSEQARLQYAADQQDLILRVSDAYFSVLNASENLNSAIAEEQAIARQLEQTRQRYEVGLLPITDVHEAQAAYDDAKVNVLVLQGVLKIAFEGLEVLTGQPHAVLAGLKDDFPVTRPDASREDWVKSALENNLQLKVSRLGRDAARHNADARKYEHLPTLSGSYSYQDLDQDSTFSGVSGFGGNVERIPSSRSTVESEVQTVAIHLNVPIFTGGAVSAQRRQANQQFIQAEETANYVMRSTTQLARSAHESVVTTAATVEARRQAITSAESALEATRAGYEVGTRNIVDVLFAERNLYQARRNYANARYNHITSGLNLKLAAGQLSPDDLYQLNAWLDPSLVIAPVVPQ